MYIHCGTLFRLDKQIYFDDMMIWKQIILLICKQDNTTQTFGGNRVSAESGHDINILLRTFFSLESDLF